LADYDGTEINKREETKFSSQPIHETYSVLNPRPLSIVVNDAIFFKSAATK
jgi:hypothetical protein